MLHTISAHGRRGAVMEMEKILTRFNPDTIILNEPDFEREFFDVFDDIQHIIVIIPVRETKDY